MKKCICGRDLRFRYIVTPSGILPNTENAKAVINVMCPHDSHTVRAFLGITSYFICYIPGYARVSAPIERLELKGAGFVWTEDYEVTLKRRWIDLPILIYPDFAKHIQLFVDSSILAAGGTLPQAMDGRDRALFTRASCWLYSKNKQDPQGGGTSAFECWGIATRKVWCYLDRQGFDLFTDPKELTWVFNENNRTTNAKLALWTMGLSQLGFKVFHKTGPLMGYVDGLSRLHSTSIAALAMTDLLYDDDDEEEGMDLEDNRNLDGGRQVQVREQTLLMSDILNDADLNDYGSVQVNNGRPTNEGGSGVVLAPGRLEVREHESVIDASDSAPDGEHYYPATVDTHSVHLSARSVPGRVRAGPARPTLEPVLPLTFIEAILHYCHADLLWSHLGTTKTIDTVHRHDWKRDVTEDVRACSVCVKVGYRPWKNGGMQRITVMDLSRPFSLMVVDVIGHLVTITRESKYIVVFADYFTRWVEAFPVKRLDTMTFVIFMVDEVVSRHGVPERLLSERGPNFISNLAMSFYPMLGIWCGLPPPNARMLRMFVGETQEDWDMYLPRVLFTYRTSDHEALRDSSFFSLYGRDPIVPLDLAFSNMSNTWKSNEVAASTRKLFLSMRTPDAWLIVNSLSLRVVTLDGLRSLRKATLSGSTNNLELDVRKAKKLAFGWHGSYRVAGPIGENAYGMAIPSHPDQIVTVIVNRMKTYPGRMSRPFSHETSDGADLYVELRETSRQLILLKRIVIGGEETAFTGVSNSVVNVLAKRKLNGVDPYLVLTASYEVCWRPTTTLLPTYKVLIDEFEDEECRASQWPELRRSARLVDANPAVDEDELLF
ncbi:LOW QUALITY PROTEIN: hypothetical protein PHMEG_0006486 [Phytophthora megakarya]|uniref:Integrase catalytic domain-containing protein n=1 Tax=Phytophthora megakarya TaxID=4795 RepID=A0A225WNU9_9STRA|nr:LOW QUALITY PROTEIN: hypothetical protein PHMEG_0006486 [Phytophthora megakarya]